MKRKPKGERRHGAGWQVWSWSHGEQVFRQFALDSTPQERQAWRQRVQHQNPPALPTGSLGRDAARWLASVKHTADYPNKRTYILRWLQRLGRTTLRAKITSARIATVLSDLLAEGYSPTTVRHHRTALRHVWTFCDGPSAPNPVDETPRPRDPEPEVRDVRLEDIRRVLDHMRPTKTRARLTLLLATGLPHAQIMRLTEADWDRTGRLLRVTRRKKGGGTAGRLLPLSEAGMAAMREFHLADAYGPFSQSAMHSALHRACDALEVPRFRPYDLRHVHGALLYLETGDLTTTARLLGHKGTKTAERYTQSAFARVDATAVAKVGLRMTATMKNDPYARRKRLLNSLRS